MFDKNAISIGVSGFLSATSSELTGVTHDTLNARLQQHLHDYLELQDTLANFQFPADRMKSAYRLAREARTLAFEISLMPEYKEDPILQRSQSALINHWRSLPFNGGVSEADYRLAVKSVLLFLVQCAHD